jgi:hypothetical protein
MLLQQQPQGTAAPASVATPYTSPLLRHEKDGERRHGHYEGRVRGRRARRRIDDLVLVRDYRSHIPELHVQHEEYL